MDLLAYRVRRIAGVSCTVDNWSNFQNVAAHLARLPVDMAAALIGYSGGGWKIAEVANMVNGVRRVELMIAIDPSPYWWTERTPIGGNVRRAICYANQKPSFMGMPFSVLRLGGGLLRGAHVEMRAINEDHAAVQFDRIIYAGVIAELKALSSTK
jgi:hypothetical protein